MNLANVTKGNKSQVAKWGIGALAAKQRSAQKIGGESREPGAFSSLG